MSTQHVGQQADDLLHELDRLIADGYGIGDEANRVQPQPGCRNPGRLPISTLQALRADVSNARATFASTLARVGRRLDDAGLLAPHLAPRSRPSRRERQQAATR